MGRRIDSRWMLFLLMSVWVGLIALTPVKAQTQPGPIIMKLNGDLWAWNSPEQPLTQLTDWGLNDHPVLSPDGTRAAYTSGASIFMDWLQTVQGAGGFYYPTNIWIADLPSGQTYRIADQPADAVWEGPSVNGKYMLRQTPVWSPNGQQLAWVELLIDTVSAPEGEQLDTLQIVVYDLISKTTQVVDSRTLPRQGQNFDAFHLEWGRSGLILKMDRLSHALRRYDPTDSSAVEVPLDEDAASRFALAGWLQDSDQDYLFDSRRPETWLNWQIGQVEPVMGMPEMYSLTAPDGAHFFYSEEKWFLELPGQSPVELGEQAIPHGISRDGQAVVYRQYLFDSEINAYTYAVVVHSQDGIIEIERDQNVQPIWGPTGWRIRSS